MRKTLKSALLGLAGLVSMGCTGNIKEGEIYEKEVEPERTWVQFMPIPISRSCGKSICTSMIIIPMFMYDSEDYVVKIKGFNQSRERVDSARVYLSKSAFDSLKVGDYFAPELRAVSFADNVEKRPATEQDKVKYGVVR